MLKGESSIKKKKKKSRGTRQKLGKRRSRPRKKFEEVTVIRMLILRISLWIDPK